MKTRTEITLEMDRVIVVKRRREELLSTGNTSDLLELAELLRSQQTAEPPTLELIPVTPSQRRLAYSRRSKRS